MLCLKNYPYISTELPPILVEQNEIRVNGIHHNPIKLDYEERKGFQQEDSQYSELKTNHKNETVSEEFSFEPKGALCKKIQDHRKEYTALIVPKLLHKYMLLESHTSLGHTGRTRLYQFLKRQYYQKHLKMAVQKFVRHCLQCKMTYLKTPIYAPLHLEVPQMPMDLISMDINRSF